MTDVDTLIRDLEEAPVGKERAAILDALTYAHASKWIDTAAFHRAQKMLHVGAFLSAALTLLPEGWWWSLETFSDGCYARVAETSKQLHCLGTQKPPALALCIAALKARSAA